MSFRSSRHVCAPLVGFVVTLLIPAWAQDSPFHRGREIQFSEPRSQVATTNLEQIVSEKRTLRSLEKDLKQPFEFFGPSSDSLSRIVTPRMPVIVPPSPKSKRVKEQLEKRDEWMFLGPEDYEPGGLTAEDMLNVPEYGPDGELKKPRTALERYYDRMEKARATATNQAGGSGISGLGGKDQEFGVDESKSSLFGGDKNVLSSGLSTMEQTLKSLSNDDDEGATKPETSAPKGFAEFFGFGKAQSLTELQEASRVHQARLEQFKQLLETRSMPTPDPGGSAANTFSSVQPSVAPLTSPGVLDPFPTSGTHMTVNRPAPSPSSLSPLPGLSGLSSLPGVSSPVGTPSWQSPPPAPPAPRATFQPSTFSLPQRKF